MPGLCFHTLFTELPGETVWIFGMYPESGLRKRPRGVQGVPIGRLLAPKKCARDAFSYFPSSFWKLNSPTFVYRTLHSPGPMRQALSCKN
jgi:hypothetical protein